MTATTKTFTEAEIDAAVLDYAIYHEVEIDAVRVSLATEGDESGPVLGFRLSLDVDGRSRGCDEKYGAWE